MIVLPHARADGFASTCLDRPASCLVLHGGEYVSDLFAYLSNLLCWLWPDSLKPFLLDYQLPIGVVRVPRHVFLEFPCLGGKFGIRHVKRTLGAIPKLNSLVALTANRLKVRQVTSGHRQHGILSMVNLIGVMAAGSALVAVAI